MFDTGFWIRLVGFAQLGVLLASLCVPLVMDWRMLLAPLPRLMRQLIRFTGAYVMLTGVYVVATRL